MICKKCGFEYVDGLKECPNCQAPNEPLEVKVLTKDERDTFDGITIEDTKDENENGFRVYDKEEHEEPKHSRIHVQTFGLGISWVWRLIFFVIIIGLIFFVLPMLAVVFFIGAVCYYLYSWLFG